MKQTVATRQPERTGRPAPDTARIDLDAGFGPLRLTERRRDFEAGRSGGWGMALESLLRGVSNLR